jgi:very-short-patch-repair endonuclease/KaiC/GvpD/RAD55 family RecA-like ATPase
MSGGLVSESTDDLLERAKNLFEFLAKTQQLRETPQRTTASYDVVTWFDDLPEHHAIASAHRQDAPEPEAAFFSVDRVPRRDAPDPAAAVRPWLMGDRDDPGLELSYAPSRPPRLLDGLAPIGEDEEVHIDDHPGLKDDVLDYIQRWRLWADLERVDRPVRNLYGEIFSMHQDLVSHAEQFELVVGVGLLAWRPSAHDPVSRHLFTFPAAVDFDEQSGRLTVRREPSLNPVRVELEMFEPSVVAGIPQLGALRAGMSEFALHPLDRSAIEPEVRSFVNILDASGRYIDADVAPAPGQDLIAAFAPALILRRRSQRGLIDIYGRIIDQLTATGRVPQGLVPLLDPDYKPSVQRDPAEGGFIAIGDEMFLPMPVNERQRRVIEAVDQKAQVVVQGPPGTGKTHTAAALLSHLLAQGKRVLVTAHTDRALHEVRAKLPEAIRPLSVAVVGTSQSDMADLRVAVETISSRADDHDAAVTARKIQAHLAAIDVLRRERAQAYADLRAAREAEVDDGNVVGAFAGTLAGIAQAYLASRTTNEWLLAYVEPACGSNPPISDVQARRWLALHRDAELKTDEAESGRRLVDLEGLPSADEFASLVDREAGAVEHAQEYAELSRHDAFGSVAGLGDLERTELQTRMRALAAGADSLSQRSEGWMADAVFDVRAGRGMAWSKRSQQVQALLEDVIAPVERFGALTTVAVDPELVGTYESMALALATFLRGGGQIKTDVAGRPKGGMLAAKVVKESAPFFENVKVNGLPPSTLERIDLFLTYVEASRILDALDRAWPASITIPAEDTLDERTQWHQAEVAQLAKVLDLGAALADAETWMAAHQVAIPDWTDLEQIRLHARLVDAAASKDAAELSKEPLERLNARLDSARQWADAAPGVLAVADAVDRRDRNAYRVARDRLVRLHEVRTQVQERDELQVSVASVSPALAAAVASAPDDARWDAQLLGLEAAWSWGAAGSWLHDQETSDINVLQAKVSRAEAGIRREIEQLAAERAWGHAVSETRISGRAQANLRQYASLVKRLGKGTGKFAAKQRQEVREALDRCRPAVPVWIMPIYRIAEQFRVEQDMFDVVFVDEASQAGLEATFLQYLAPKIVVIGDDKQVSPAAVGVQQQPIRDLADQYLANDPYKATWQDPKRSLFDEASMRFGGKITLVEHRRCLPEIIGFSNRIAYEPDNVRLIPVRQRRADSLAPVRAVHVTNGYEQGRTNQPEADAIVAQVLACLKDPEYVGKTFGVISLMGGEQAELIRRRLLVAVDDERLLEKHEIRCGDAADFQGSERDVIFLSMVKAPKSAGDKRIVPNATTDMYVQRYNVAASRAKDQMWLFHSVVAEDIGNPADMRRQLLDYVYGVINRESAHDERILHDAVPENDRVEPFDSLFEQRVFNRINGRGYTVIPQYPAEGYNIDLVVLGANGMIAIECDGDRWHGPDQYDADLARQRDLERCGWTFFRVRESAFYLDGERALGDLWPMLDELGAYSPAKTSALTVIQSADVEPQQELDLQVELDLADVGMLAFEPAPAEEVEVLFVDAAPTEIQAQVPPADATVVELPRLEGETPWTEVEWDGLVETLADRFDRSAVLVDSLEREIAGRLSASEREQKTAVRRAEAANLHDLRVANRKVRAGTFGSCDGCGDPVGKNRLLVRPQAAMCLGCS